jgi:alpha-L-rhamnosidase
MKFMVMLSKKIVLTTLFLTVSICGASVNVTDLQCEYRHDPSGIDMVKPRLSWKLLEKTEGGNPHPSSAGLQASKSARGVIQSAYQILVASSEILLNQNKGDFWDSGKVLGDQSVQVEYGGKPFEVGIRYVWKVRIWPGGEWSKSASFTTGLHDWQAKWISAGEQQSSSYPSMFLRREFTGKAKVRRALAFVCGLGQYELTINGQKAGDALLTPGWTKYNKTCLYDTCDVTALFRDGRNIIDLLLGNGMYNVTGGRYTKFQGSFGPPKAIAQVQIEYADGTTEVIGTDERWQVSPGPITFSNIYGGEDYDARWQPHWVPAVVVSGPGGQLKGLSCAAPPIRVFETLKPVSQKQIKPGVTVYDLGQNAALMPRIAVRGPAGAKVKITTSELIKASGELDDTMCGGQSFCTYTLLGKGTETWMPKFYYNGARYLQVECSGGAEVEAIQGVVVHSSSTSVGEFKCSDDLFNRIAPLVRWAQMNNMMSVMTDCPTREKLGWVEEDYLNGPSLRYNFDLAALFTKSVNDMSDSQLDNGLVPDIAPEYPVFDGGFRDSPEWGSAFILVPWQQYQFAGDREMLRRHYDAMQRYVAYLGSRGKDHIIDYGLGDWYDIGPRGPGEAQLTPKALTATAIYYEDVCVMEKAAQLLGHVEDARRYGELAGQIRTAFNSKFSNLPVSQTGMAMPLVVGLVDPSKRQTVLDALVKDVQAKGLTSGDVGYRYLLRALADGGRSDVVFAMNHQSDKPGYGYQLKMGATSLTEAWDAQRGSSQDHFMLGQINEWFYHDLAGIQCDPEGPGFKKIIIKPAVVGDLTWVKAQFNSPYGLIISHWQRVGNRLTMDVKIPANTTATVFVSTKDASGVTESGQAISRAKSVKFLRMESGAAVYEVGSGIYQFNSNIK